MAAKWNIGASYIFPFRFESVSAYNGCVVLFYINNKTDRLGVNGTIWIDNNNQKSTIFFWIGKLLWRNKKNVIEWNGTFSCVNVNWKIRKNTNNKDRVTHTMANMKKSEMKIEKKTYPAKLLKIVFDVVNGGWRW